MKKSKPSKQTINVRPRASGQRKTLFAKKDHTTTGMTLMLCDFRRKHRRLIIDDDDHYTVASIQRGIYWRSNQLRWFFEAEKRPGVIIKRDGLNWTIEGEFTRSELLEAVSWSMLFVGELRLSPDKAVFIGLAFGDRIDTFIQDTQHVKMTFTNGPWRQEVFTLETSQGVITVTTDIEKAGVQVLNYVNGQFLQKDGFMNWSAIARKLARKKGYTLSELKASFIKPKSSEPSSEQMTAIKGHYNKMRELVKSYPTLVKGLEQWNEKEFDSFDINNIKNLPLTVQQVILVNTAAGIMLTENIESIHEKTEDSNKP